MKLNDYVIGKGKQNKSFCYRIERELDRLGRISGTPAIKFGIYFGKMGKSKNGRLNKYRYSKIWGENEEDAFKNIKDAIVTLLIDANKNNINGIQKNKLSPMFKGKLLFLFHPDKYSMTFSKDHLIHFTSELNLKSKSNNILELQQLLVDYRKSIPLLNSASPYLYNKLLYDILKRPNKKDDNLPPLKDVLKGVEVINAPPRGGDRDRQGVDTKQDYDALYKKRKRIGDRGESIVFQYERKRLEDEGKPKLAKKVDHVSDRSDKEGFDILSFETDGKEKRIEVKATSNKTINGGFFFSVNEYKKSANLDNYYLALVTSALSRRPKVCFIKHPMLNDTAIYDLQTVIYKIKIKQYI